MSQYSDAASTCFVWPTRNGTGNGGLAQLVALGAGLLVSLAVLMTAAGALDYTHLNLPSTRELIEDVQFGINEVNNLVHATANPEEVDSDGDGLLDAEEFRLGTSITHADTDMDGLSDFDEVRVYHTDPLNNDSDGDGVLDGEAAKRGIISKMVQAKEGRVAGDEAGETLAAGGGAGRLARRALRD